MTPPRATVWTLPNQLTLARFPMAALLFLLIWLEAWPWCLAVFALAAFTDVSGPPAWRTIPSRFIYGDQDKNLPTALQTFMAERAGSQETVEIKGGSHVVMISHPDEVAEMIQQSALAQAATRSAA